MNSDVGRVIPPPFLFIACLALSAFAQHFRPVSIADYSFMIGMLVGSVTLLLSVSVASWGILEMKRLKTTIQPGQIPTRLVTTGPFRFTRNPLYVALLLVFTALAIMENSLWLAGGTGVLWLLLDRLVVVREEVQIRQTFGSEYSAYAARVRRWL